MIISPSGRSEATIRDRDSTPTRPYRSEWRPGVTEADGSIVGLTGLFEHATRGEIEPVVVTEPPRGQGVGRLLIDRVVAESVARGDEYLAIRPVARNVGFSNRAMKSWIWTEAVKC